MNTKKEIKTNRTLDSTRTFIYNTLTTCIRELVGERTKEWEENGETESEQLYIIIGNKLWI